jgi:deoxynogalonate / 12-deoxyaklanonic acid monooxygenase
MSRGSIAKRKIAEMFEEEPDATEGEPVTFVNMFTVRAPAGEFERVFARTASFMSSQPGFLRHTLLRNISEEGSYVNIAHWQDLASFRRALVHPDFRRHAEELRALSTSQHGLYVQRASLPATQRGR